MLNSSGRELNIVQISSEPIVNKSFALNIKGNLRNWTIDKSGDQYLGYLETPAKAKKIGKTSAKYFVKNDGTIKAYFEKDGDVFSQTMDEQEAKLLETGAIMKIDDESVYIKKSNKVVVISHEGVTNYLMDISFNEISSIHSISLEGQNALLLMDYLKNKIYLFYETGGVYDDFPKEGRNKVYINPNDMNEKLSIFTTIENAIICYKVKL